MNPWVVLAIVVALVLLHVLAAVAVAWKWRRPWRLTCPHNGAVAQIRVGATRAAVAEVLGRRVEIDRCSQRSALLRCRQQCLTTPMTAWQRMRRGEPPPRTRTDADVRVILVPLDGTPGSEAVLPAVGELARLLGATARLLRVVPPTTETRTTDGRIVAYADQEGACVEAAARAYLTRVGGLLGDVTVDHTVRVGGDGDVVTQILEEAEEVGADLIAMATHRRDALDAIFRGNLARRLERMTTIPLLLVPYGQRVAA
jgi:nucleotide-binding universal stress UspA family protein